MASAAFYTQDLVISYSTVVIAFGVLSCFFLIWSLFTANGGKAYVMCFFIPLAFCFSLLLSRLIHWYCHPEQYSGLKNALTVYSSGDFVFSGVIAGTLLAILICGIFFSFRRTSPLLLDCSCPALVLLLIFVRLSGLFSSTCISKFTVTSELFQTLPFSVKYTDSAGNSEYRFATFFVEALCLAVLFIVLLLFFFKKRSIPAKRGKSNSGSAGAMALIGCSAIEILMDSTRYDSSFFPFNGFVSVVQIVCGVIMLFIFIIYSSRAIRADGFKGRHAGVMAGWLIALAGTGVAEYMVQRHGDLHMYCYIGMTICLIFWAFFTVKMYAFQCDEAEEAV